MKPEQESLKLEGSSPGATEFDLRCMDCVAGMGTLREGSVDVVVTSPPYNLDIKYRSYEDRAERGDYLDWCQIWGSELRRVLKPEGSLFLNIGASPSNPLLPHQLALRFADLFVLQNTIHWIKSVSIDLEHGEVFSRGHFKPINSKVFLNDCHEYIFHFSPTGRTAIDRKAVGVPYQHKSNIARWGHTNGEDRRCRGNNWFIPYRTINSRDAERPHPATFPVQLATQCLKLHGASAHSVVLDPFLGLGNSAMAARECGAGKFVGFEIDDYYFSVASRKVGGL